MTTETTGFETRLASAGLGQGWTWSHGSWWLDCTESFDLRATTEKLLALGARFICITATERTDSEIRLDYQWDFEDQLLSFSATTRNKAIVTISDLSPAADWVERETREYFAVEFTGRETTLPLMTRMGDGIGINLRKEVQQ